MSTPIYQLSGRPMQMGLLLKLPYLELERYTSRRLAELGYGEVRPAHYAVFQVLKPEGSRLTELAERAGMTKQSMGYLVDHLEENGYLQRVPDPADQRAQIIRITPRAKQFDEAVETVIDELHATWAGGMGKAKFKQLRDLLGDLVGVLQEGKRDSAAAPTAPARQAATPQKKKATRIRSPLASAQDRI
jgi:DNA-binding MarR family transcriptional regulator